MSFGIFSRDGAASILLSDSFNPYYYRGVASDREQTAPGAVYSQDAISYRQAFTGTFDGTVRVSGLLVCFVGNCFIPRYGDSDLIFVEPVDSGVGFGISKVEPTTKNGDVWKISYSLYWNKPYYEPTYEDPMVGVISSALIPKFPKFHIFSQLSMAAPPADRYGFAVYSSSGVRKYDSSMLPLRLKQMLTANLPTPIATSTLDRHPTGIGFIDHVFCARPMYCMPHISQAVHESPWADSVNKFGWLVSASASVDYTFWGAYAGALISRGNSQVGLTWGLQAFGMFGATTRSGSAIFGLIPTGSSTVNSGSPPFDHSNANASDLPVLVADVADYIN